MAGLEKELAKKLISILQKVDVVKYGTFTLKDGTISRVYIDLRVLPNFPVEFQETTQLAAGYLQERGLVDRFDAITAPPLAGVPLGVALALELNKPFFLTRLQAKEHGTRKLIEGDISGKRLLVVDDVITSGGSKIPLINTVRNYGGEIESIFVYVNRMENIQSFEGESGVAVEFLLSLEHLQNGNK